MTRALTLTVAALAMAAACSSFRPHARSSTDVNGRVFGNGPTAGGEDRTRGLPASRPGAATQVASAGADAQQVCRSGSRPSGWIAVAYVSGDMSCTMRASADSAHNIAVLARLTNLAVSNVLEVCADEPIPHDWVLDAPGEPSAACPGLKGNPPSTTKTIRRVR